MTTQIVEKICQAVPLEVDDIISLLQAYKPAAMKVFRNKVNLFFDRQTKEIKFEIPCHGGYYLKKVIYYQLGYRVLGLDELIVPVYILRLVDEWIERVLTPVEAEIVFHRFIDHDFEWDVDPRDWRLRYRTLDYREIAKRMNMDEVTVWRTCKRALNKILMHVNQNKPP